MALSYAQPGVNHDLPHNAADIPGAYTALPMAAQQDQVCIPRVGNFNNLFCGSAIIKMRGHPQTGILQESSYTREITLCLGFTNLPIHRVNQAQARCYVKRFRDAQ